MKLTFCNGTVLHRNQVRSTFGDWLDGITELSKSLQAIDIDASAYACLSALTLVNGEFSIFIKQRWCSDINFMIRAPRFAGAQEGWESANQDHQLAQGPRDLQPGRAEEAALLQPHPGQAAGAAVPEPAGAPEDLLSPAGGAGPRASDYQNTVLLEHSVLNSARILRDSGVCAISRLWGISDADQEQ